MFSATLTEEVEALIHQYFNQPAKIEAAPAGSPLANILQSAYEVPNFYTKVNLLKLLLQDAAMSKVLVFTATKKLADAVFEEVQPAFVGQVGIIHSNKSQNHRFEMVRQFHSGGIRVLIATDVVARGIDISEVSHVINFDIPEQPESYIHRIGRTGRADKKGIAITFITPVQTEAREAIEALMNYKIPVEQLPEALEISEELTYDERPEVYQPNMDLKMGRKGPSGGAFHEKSEKNSKTPGPKITRAAKLRAKYGKPKTKGGNKPKRKR
jgi:ATP-dependent RNA helicase RhlE